MWSAWFSSPKILIVIFRRQYIASWCLVKDVSFIHLFVKYACLRTASVEKSSCFFDLCLQPKQKIEPLFSLPIRTDHILPVLKHIVSLPDKGKTELFKMCILTVPGYLSSRFGRSSGGGGRGSLRYSFLTLTLFCTQVCDCPLPACFKPTAITRFQTLPFSATPT